MANSRTTVHISDVLADPDYKMAAGGGRGSGRLSARCSPFRFFREGDLIGSVRAHARRSVCPFNDKEIELVKTFADQAVIAIENVRLFEEVQARNRELTEALEQQVATSSILRVIAASPTDIQPVLDTVTESAARLCDAYDATLFLRRGEALAVAAHHGAILIDFAELPISRDIVTGRAVADRVPVHVHDLTTAGEEFPAGQVMARRLGFRTILATPLLREGKAIGALMIRRAEVRPFSEKQIELLGFSPTRRLSQSRTSGYSKRCGRVPRSSPRRSSKRRRRPTSSRSSAARHSICRRVLDTLREISRQALSMPTRA